MPSPQALSRGKSDRSSSSTRASGRRSFAASAAAEPAGPPPTTSRSQVSATTTSVPREQILCGPVQTLVVDHPLAAARLTTLRDERTDNTGFRVALKELATMLVYEATRTLPVEPVPVTTPVAPAVGARPSNPPLLVPVLVLDPMLATGGSLLHSCRLLTDRGCDDITVVCVLVAPEGQRALEQSGLPLRLVTAAIDERLNEKAYIVPGLGDAGDRQFGAVI